MIDTIVFYSKSYGVESDTFVCSFSIDKNLGTITKISKETRLKNEINYYKEIAAINNKGSVFFPRMLSSIENTEGYEMELEYYGYDNLGDHMVYKPFDVSCMFGYPTEEPVYEHDLCQTDYYDPHRKSLLDKLENTNYKVAKLVDGKRISHQEYIQNMYNSKIIMAPLGYGEVAVRDIETAMLGSILMKPDMSNVNTSPNIYVDDETYIAVKYDWSNLIEKIDYVLDNYESLQSHLVEGMRWKFVEELKPEKTAQHLYNILLETEGVEVES